MELLRTEALSKIFLNGEGEVNAVNKVDLLVEPGEVVLIMGPSGSGKTTLLFMLGGLLRPSSGRVVVDGIDITPLNEKRLAKARSKSFGFIFQDFNLLSALTAQENVEVVMNLAGYDSDKARTRAFELLKMLGLEKRIGFLPENLSGGEKQRVCIARALANSPPLILADEPTANLDSATGRTVARLLKTLAEGNQRSVIIVSHDARIMDIANRTFLMEDGCLRILGNTRPE